MFAFVFIPKTSKLAGHIVLWHALEGFLHLRACEILPLIPTMGFVVGSPGNFLVIGVTALFGLRFLGEYW